MIGHKSLSGIVMEKLNVITTPPLLMDQEKSEVLSSKSKTISKFEFQMLETGKL
jgi:hypothetical protein